MVNSKMGVFEIRSLCTICFITARIPKEWGRCCFHRCLSVHTREGDTYFGLGVPTLDRGGGGAYLGWGNTYSD